MKCRTVQSRSFSQQVFQFILRVLSGRWQQRYGKFWTDFFEEFVPASLPRVKDFAAVSKTSLKVATFSLLVFTLENERFHLNFFLERDVSADFFSAVPEIKLRKTAKCINALSWLRILTWVVRNRYRWRWILGLEESSFMLIASDYITLTRKLIS